MCSNFWLALYMFRCNAIGLSRDSLHCCNNNSLFAHSNGLHTKTKKTRLRLCQVNLHKANWQICCGKNFSPLTENDKLLSPLALHPRIVMENRWIWKRAQNHSGRRNRMWQLPSALAIGNNPKFLGKTIRIEGWVYTTSQHLVSGEKHHAAS